MSEVENTPQVEENNEEKVVTPVSKISKETRFKKKVFMKSEKGKTKKNLKMCLNV